MSFKPLAHFEYVSFSLKLGALCLLDSRRSDLFAHCALLRRSIPSSNQLNGRLRVDGLGTILLSPCLACDPALISFFYESFFETWLLFTPVPLPPQPSQRVGLTLNPPIQARILCRLPNSPSPSFLKQESLPTAPPVLSRYFTFVVRLVDSSSSRMTKGSPACRGLWINRLIEP